MKPEQWTYAEKLQTPMWFRRRRLVLERDRYTCRSCGWRPTPSTLKHICEPSHLEVHHLYYDRSLEPWQYPEHALVTLCDRCHAAEGGHLVLFSGTDKGFLDYCLTPRTRKPRFW